MALLVSEPHYLNKVSGSLRSEDWHAWASNARLHSTLSLPSDVRLHAFLWGESVRWLFPRLLRTKRYFSTDN